MRVNVAAASAAVGAAAGAKDTGDRSRTGSTARSAPASARSVVSAAASFGTGHDAGGVAPGPRRPNSSRCSGEVGAVVAGTHHVTTWQRARVSATYSSRRSSPASSASWRAQCSDQRGPPAPPTSRTRASSSSCSRGTSGSRGTYRSQPNGTYTTGNSSPLLRCTVMTCTAAASESSRLLRSSPTSAAASSMRWRSHSTSAAGPRCASTAAACSACPTCRTSVSRRSPSATPSSRPGRPVPVVTASSSAATPLPCSTAAQRRRVAPRSSSSASAASSSPPAPHSSATDRPRKQVRAASRIRIGRSCSSACSSVSHSRAAGVPNTLVVPERTAGTPTEASASRMTVPWSFVRTSTATSPGRSGAPSTVAPEASSAATSACGVAGDPRPRLRGEHEPAAAARQPVAGEHPQAQRGAHRCSGQPRHRVRGLHLPHDDPGITQRRPAEHRVQRAQQPGVAAPVPGERGVGVGLPGGLEVADDVRAPEGVDRLLRVADQYQRHVPGEVPQDAPLQRVRVLELVDEHDAVPGPQPRRRPADGIGQRVVQAGDQVVVGVQTACPLAALHLAAHRRRERVADRCGSRRPDGLQPRLRIAHGPPGQPQCLDAVERGRAGGLRGELADVEVVGDLDHQVVHGLDEDRVVGISGDPERGQHLAAELVRGRDRRRVELGERSGQPPAANGDLGVRDPGEQRQYRVGARPRRWRGHAARARRSPAARGRVPAAPAWRPGRR